MTRTRTLFVVALVALAAVGVRLGLHPTAATAQSGALADPGGPYAATAGSAIQFDGSHSAGVGLSYVWTFGDGTSAVGARPVKVYTLPSVYPVTLTVTDLTGARSVATTTATISGVRLVGPGGCLLTLGGWVCSGGGVGSVVGLSGCVLTGAGWVCPSALTAGVIVTTPQPLSAPLLNCNLPATMFTPLCRALDRS